MLQCKIMTSGNSLVVQWLRLHALTAEGSGLIPGPAATWLKKKKNDIMTNISFLRFCRTLPWAVF